MFSLKSFKAESFSAQSWRFVGVVEIAATASFFVQSTSRIPGKTAAHRALIARRLDRFGQSINDRHIISRR